MIRYTRKKIRDSEGNWVDPISVRLARMMLLADCPDYRAAFPDYRKQALGLIRVDGIVTLLLPVILGFMSLSLAPLITICFGPREARPIIALTLAILVSCAVAFVALARDSLTEILTPDAALALRQGTILDDLSRKRSGPAAD